MSTARKSSLIFAVAGIIVLGRPAPAQEVAITYPRLMGSPTSFADCGDLKAKFDELFSVVDNRHASCMGLHAGEPEQPGANQDPDNPVCGHRECQADHDARIAIRRQSRESVDRCHQEVQSYLATLHGCVPGCKRWNMWHGMSGKPVCQVMIYCPANPASPPDEEQRAPAIPAPR